MLPTDITNASRTRIDSETTERNTHEGGSPWRRRPLLHLVGAAGGSLLGPLISTPVRAGHETDPCPVTIEFNRARIARVSDVAAAGLTSLTVFYFDGDGDAQKQEDVDPTTNAEYGTTPLRVRYDAVEDKTTLQVGGRNVALRRVVAYGPDCRSDKTNPLDSAAGDNETPDADFAWTPEPGVTHEPITFRSTAGDPDGELVHYGWDFDADGEEDATGDEVSYTFASAGDHDVTHTVIDDFDAADSETKPVSVLPWGQVAKLAADDGDDNDRFGSSVAVDGDTAVIAAVSDENPNGSGAGSAYVFTRSGGRWDQQQKLDAGEDGDEFDDFGSAVAVHDDTAVIGAFGDDASTGAAYVFTRNGDHWDKQERLTAEDGDENDRFGVTVAVHDDTAVVGALTDDRAGEDDVGSAYVFTLNGESWDQQEKLTADDGDAFDNFGSSVAVDGDTAVVGAVSDDDPNGSGAGAAYVFTRSGESWNEQRKLSAEDGDEDDRFGESVALDDDTAVVGADKHVQGSIDVDAGSAYVFTRSGGSWDQQQKLTADDDDRDDAFGESVAVDGDTAVVGATYDEDPNGSGAGSADVFTRSGATWSHQRKLAAADGDEEDNFGRSVAVDGDIAVIGAVLDEDPNEEWAGSAYVFRR